MEHRATNKTDALCPSTINKKQMNNTNSRNVRLAYMNEEGNWTTLAFYKSYERADKAHEQLSKDFPNTYFELLDGALANA